MKTQVAQFVPYTDMLNLPIELPDIYSMSGNNALKLIKSSLSKTKNVYFSHNGNIYYLTNFSPAYTFSCLESADTANGTPYITISQFKVTFTGQSGSFTTKIYSNTAPAISSDGTGI